MAMAVDVVIAALAASVIVGAVREWRERREAATFLRRIRQEYAPATNAHGVCGCVGDQHCNACFDAVGR